MFEYLFLKLSFVIRILKAFLCKVFYINHDYHVKGYSKPYYLNVICGGGDGQSHYKGIFIDQIKKCDFCGKEEIEKFFRGGYSLDEIEEFTLKKYDAKWIATKRVEIIKKLSYAIEDLERFTFYKFDITNGEYTEKEFIRGFKCLRYIKFERFGNYVVIFKS